MADLGLVGLVIATLLLLVWVARGAERHRAASLGGSCEPTATMRRRRAATGTPNRIALVTLALVPVVFGVQSLIDWTWFIQAPTAMALVGAGFIAGRGPLGPRSGPSRAQRPRRPDRFRIAGAVAAVGTALLLAWTIWQPEASDRATNEALALADERKFDEAIDEDRGRERT